MIQILNILHESQRRILPLFWKNTSVGSYRTYDQVSDILDSYSIPAVDIPLTNRVRGLYRKLRTEFFPPRFMAQARSARAINRREKNENP